jgi:hypothetical protein
VPLSDSHDLRKFGAWRWVSLALFMLIILFSFASLANLDKLSKQSAAFQEESTLFQRWLHDQTAYVIDRDAAWDERFERIDRTQAAREVIFARLVKMLDAIDAEKAKAKAR